MPVLIFLDQSESTLKKTTPEVMSYGAQVAAQLGTTAEGVLLGTFNGDVAALGKYGVGKIHHANDASLDHPDGEVYTNIICKVAEDIGAKVIIFSQNLHGRAIAPRVSAKLKAGLVAGAVGLPDTSNGFVVKKNVFSGKAFANIAVNTDIKIISLNPNSFQASGNGGTAEVVALTVAPAPARTK